MKLITVALLALFISTPALAVSKKCPPTCAHRAKSAACVKSAPVVAPTLATQLLEGLEVAAGFRWQAEDALAVCVATSTPRPGAIEPPRVHDPFYLGVGLRVPLNDWVALHGRFDRDFVEAPQWQIRAEVVAQPWKRQ